MTDAQILVSRYFEDPGSMTQYDLDQLSEWIKQDPAHAKQFAQAAFIHRAVYDSLTSEQTQEALTVPSSSPSSDDSEFWWDDNFWHWMAEYEKTAPSVVQRIKPEPPSVKTASKPALEPVKRTKRYPLLATICAVLLFMLVVGVQIEHWLGLTEMEVATVTDMLDAKVEGPVLTPHLTRLTNKSGPITLTSGVVKIEFDCGVKAVIEGPAYFEIQSAKRIVLNEGKLYAQVSNSGRGFRVDTPSSSIIDLGTEFGIHVQNDRSSNVHMVRGRATVEARGANHPSGGRLITEGQARRVRVSGVMDSIDIDRSGFIRDINSVTETYWRGEWLTVIFLPAQDTDQASGISPVKTYTHLLDFGLGEAATVNGVPFTPVDFNEPFGGPVFRDVSLDLTLTRHGAKSFGSFQNEHHTENADGGIQTLLSDSVFLSNQYVPDHYALALTGLIPGQTYSLRLYYCTDQMEPVRSNRLVFNGEGYDREILINQQAGGANYVRYDYTAASNRVDVTFQPQEVNRSWHLYGLSNEVIDVGH